jgi:hypothetical protein
MVAQALQKEFNLDRSGFQAGCSRRCPHALQFEL